VFAAWHGEQAGYGGFGRDFHAMAQTFILDLASENAAIHVAGQRLADLLRRHHPASSKPPPAPADVLAALTAWEEAASWHG